MDDILRIYIGWDQREDEAWWVCQKSIVHQTSRPVHITPIKQGDMIRLGLYRRTWLRNEKGQRVDSRDGKPFSTDFSFTRFLVPALNHYRGWALFVDCDFLFRTDIAELFALADPEKAVMCVQHQHDPNEAVKMDGQEQTRYRRKNWSSLVLWNCGHPSNRDLTHEVVNTRSGGWLHAFSWLKEEEIGSLPVEWNWLEGWSPAWIKPKAVHYTRGGPWFPDYQNVAYAGEWTTKQKVVRQSRVDEGVNPPQRKEAADD